MPPPGKMFHAKARSREKKGFEFNPPFAPSRLRARSLLLSDKLPITCRPVAILLGSSSWIP